MDSIENKIKKIEDLLITAATSVSSARLLLSEISWNEVSESDKDKLISLAWEVSSWVNNNSYWEDKIVEWVFDWERMIDHEWHTYPIPANYISKSKLVEWDWLKLTIWDWWRFLYKQIKPIPRKHIIWTLSLEDGQYKVIWEWKAYNVVLAAVTYFKAEIWDKVAIIVPESWDSKRAAIESVIPNE